LSVYLAKHPDFAGSGDNNFTLIFTGAQPNPKFTPGSNLNQYTNPDDAYEFQGFCPPECGDLDI
jgi:hypothetical protein